MRKVRIALIDDHSLFRGGLRSLLEQMPWCSVVGEAEDAQAGLRLIDAQKPDVVLLDINLKATSGLEVLARAGVEHPDVKVIMLSVHSEQEYVDQALRGGARGYLVKDASLLEVELAVQTVTTGDIYVSPSASRHIIHHYLQQSSSTGPADGLTARQREILRLIAAGAGTKEIAHQLGISPKTVETHRAQLMERLGISDVASLVRYALRAGLVKLDD